MPNDSAVALIAPYVAQDLSRARAEGGGPTTLMRMAGRGELRRLPEQADLDPWRVGVLQIMGLAHSVEQYPEGAVMAATNDGDALACWLRATPLHFVAGLSDLSASPLNGADAVSDEERRQLAATLDEHLQAEGFQLRNVGGCWIVRAPQVLNASTRRPQAAVANLEGAMPTGADAGALRRLMAELQMLLHDHEVNQRRARRGAPEVNAIWLHGLGVAPKAERRDLPEAFGDEPYLHGLYRLHGRRMQRPLSSVDELLARKPGRILALVGDVTLDALEERWLTPLLRALHARQIGTLDLVLDRWRITLARAGALKFWRGACPPARWPA